jgi:hypothetical protein
MCFVNVNCVNTFVKSKKKEKENHCKLTWVSNDTQSGIFFPQFCEVGGPAIIHNKTQTKADFFANPNIY